MAQDPLIHKIEQLKTAIHGANLPDADKIIQKYNLYYNININYIII